MAVAVAGDVADFVLGLSDSKSDDIARDLFEKKISLLQVVESLGEFLTSSNVLLRKRGTQLMADLMQKLPLDYLTEKEASHVASFLLSMLSDHHSIQPFALKGLAAVIMFNSFPGGEMTQQICNKIFHEIQNQTLSQKDRYTTYSIFLNLLTYHLADLQPLGDTFVCGYVQLMDGEKDPRNLMAAFRCSRLICQYFSLGTMVEDMFEVNACYFPVDFVPPPNDPHGITRDDLRLALQHVMSATPLFAQYCYPLLLEKMSSDVQSAKVDALKTLIACLPVYQMNHLQEYLGSLFSQIIREVRSHVSEEIVHFSLEAITAITKELSKDSLQLAAYLTENKADLLHQAQSDSPAMQLVSLQVLVAMAKASAQACLNVAAVALPVICSCYQQLTKWDQYVSHISEIVSLLQLIGDHQAVHFDIDIFLNIKEKIIDFCHKLLENQNTELQVLGIRGLGALSLWSDILSVQEVTAAMEKLTVEAVQTESDARRESHAVIIKIFKHQKNFRDEVTSYLSNVLYKNVLNYSQIDCKHRFDNSVSLLVASVVDKIQAEHASKIFLNILQASDTDMLLIPVTAALSTILASSHLTTQHLTVDIVPDMLSWLRSKCKEWPDQKQHIHEKVLTNLADGLRLAILSQDKSVQQHLSADVYGLVTSSMPMLTELGGGPCGDVIAKLPWQESRLIQLIFAIIPSLHQDESWTQQLLLWLPGMALYSVDVYTRLQACKCEAAVVNMMLAGPILDGLLISLQNKISSCLDKGSLSHLRSASLTLLTWLTKAVVVRGHKSAFDLTEVLLSALQDKYLALQAAESFNIILAPFDDVLCTAVQANVIPTYQQRFVVQTLPKLVVGFHDALPDNKEYYLMAVAGMLMNIPHQVMTTELPEVMPLLVSSLKGGKCELHKQALAAISLGIQHMPELLTAYLSDILNDCLRLAVSGGNMKLRILALKCLQQVSSLPNVALQPYKSEVLKGVKPALDDRKRLVRREAMAVRSIWCLL
ncbi:MMS19 nucleotide excision repair protein homolog isoform X2 [Pomacea canaliculata]|uniref:MMS19 nucleotide excision repair protein homolog isoform X2 n=1 Tax=Pomacea canaliculata TaxID=400727 RepID=UPI000D736E9E|nr:MMS19 nucleotide excision repair protein homolog isoform X2 [Pomacea canaliculata]